MTGIYLPWKSNLHSSVTNIGKLHPKHKYIKLDVKIAEALDIIHVVISCSVFHKLWCTENLGQCHFVTVFQNKILLVHHMHMVWKKVGGNLILWIIGNIYLTIEDICHSKCNFKKTVINFCFLLKLNSAWNNATRHTRDLLLSALGN